MRFVAEELAAQRPGILDPFHAGIRFEATEVHRDDRLAGQVLGRVDLRARLDFLDRERAVIHLDVVEERFASTKLFAVVYAAQADVFSDELVWIVFLLLRIVRHEFRFNLEEQLAVDDVTHMFAIG